MEDPMFCEKYVKMFEKHLLDVCKTNGVNTKDNNANKNVVFVKDCSREHIWRHKLIQGYKANRDDKAKTFDKNVFVHTYQHVLPALIEKYGFQTISNRSLEADDVIAIITRRLLDQQHSHKLHITIITNDNDYIQLLTHPSLKGGEGQSCLVIKNMQDKNIWERTGCSPDIYIEVKKILGDKSDNIPCITSKCGHKTALKLATDKTLLEKLFHSCPNAKKQYELNHLLIDFDCIPTHLKEEVENKINIHTP
jgi:DNA polymerase-1